MERSVNTWDITELLSGFQERMAKIALFDPLFELARQRRNDRGGKPVAMMELGLLTLLFFFEKKLLRSRRTSVKDLVEFLTAVLSKAYDLDGGEVEDIARKVIQVFRPASGRKREFGFTDPVSGEQEVVYTSILRTDSYDAATNTQYYALDEDGLELVFATKEFYLEFQLSIHQLLLRKQLEKGEFQGALRQIDEMHVDVETLQERIHTLEHEIKRSIVSEETLTRYRSLLEDIYLRLKRENEEFGELRGFVKETKDRLYAERELQKQRPYELIVRIAVELERVHNEHTMLLQRSMELESQALRAAKESLYYTGMTSFNFEQDIASFIFSTPLPLEAMQGITAPFLKVEQHKSWSLLTVFAKHQLAGEDEGKTADESILEIDGGQEEAPFFVNRRKLFHTVTELLLDYMAAGGQQEARLGSFIAYLRETEHAGLLANRNFYDYWLVLHQRSPIRAMDKDSLPDEGQGGLYEAVTDLLKGQTLTLQEIEGDIQAHERYSIQDMTVRLGGDKDAG
ncbi:hypothetical protein SAMN02799630_05010 [Paenibacillus sp. UNCCL117]|uniref:replicative DNA helicase n=1 Tax=unclassified Paenibacillus TaxID=185978 RepID=UPI00088AA532|nr:MULTISPECIES: replicative DNA helicase [unclassified Paenibacillus]SDE25717.1 hypothetical protein SAMN04488602_12323 [Paenibacillus sp. cl123]SFW62476.1 hypothetical protein SAMN02799630_05010 [Paenibacillus sp. UNCCL117]